MNNEYHENVKYYFLYNACKRVSFQLPLKMVKQKKKKKKNKENIVL